MSPGSKKHLRLLLNPCEIQTLCYLHSLAVEWEERRMRPERGAVGKSPVPHTFGKSSMSPWGHFKGPHFIHMEVSAETLLMLVWGSVLTSARRRQEEPISQSRLWEFAEVACESAWHQLLPCGTEEYSLVSSRKFAADNLGMMWHGRDFS